MIGKHRQIAGHEPVALIIIPVLIHPSAAPLHIQHLIGRHQGRNIGRPHKPVAVRPRIGVSHHPLAAGHRPLRVRRPQQQPGTLRHQPANPVLRCGAQRQSQRGIILLPHLETVEVIRLAQPHRLRLGLRSGQYQALLKHIHQGRKPVHPPERRETPHQRLPGRRNPLRNRGNIIPKRILRGSRHLGRLRLHPRRAGRHLHPHTGTQLHITLRPCLYANQKQTILRHRVRRLLHRAEHLRIPAAGHPLDRGRQHNLHPRLDRPPSLQRHHRTRR